MAVRKFCDICDKQIDVGDREWTMKVTEKRTGGPYQGQPFRKLNQQGTSSNNISCELDHDEICRFCVEKVLTFIEGMKSS